MQFAYDSGWTMARFVRWAFGPRDLAYLAVDVDLAKRSAELLAGAPEPDEIRRRLAILTRAIELRADARFLREEAAVAGALTSVLQVKRFEPWMLERLRGGYALLERMIGSRLARMAMLLRSTPERSAIGAAA